MCCIFTCCGWMIDLVQRLWTFTMSCCISSAVCCVMLTSSMSGIALGYNYSLAEYIDLKETNVSIYLKRGVFDDEIVDDMDWRRAGRMPVAGQIGGDNLMTGAPADNDATTLRSGRRLDDSVFEADDQNKYEGSLMKLTAKPPFQSTPAPLVTSDVEMGEAVSKYPSESLDQMKAIQSLIDSRKSMNTGGTTLSPLATYKAIDGMLPYYSMYMNPKGGGRRVMPQGPPIKVHELYPARAAVPDVNIGSPMNWRIQKRPDLFKEHAMPDDYVFSPTYPSPITMNLGPVRPTQPFTGGLPVGAVLFESKPVATPERRTTKTAKLEKESEAFNDKFLLENDIPGSSKYDLKKLMKMGQKSPEEEYEDEIKGLPVRRKRSMKLPAVPTSNVILTEINITNIQVPSNTNLSKTYSGDGGGTRVNYTSSTVNEVTRTLTASIKEMLNFMETTLTNTTNQSDLIESDESQIITKTPSGMIINQQVIHDKLNSDLNHKTETTSKKHSETLNKSTTAKSLLSRLVSIINTNKSALQEETTQYTNNVSAKRIKRKKGNNSFESKIVSSKYVTNSKPRSFDTKRTKISNAEVLNSISVSLNEAGLLRNPASSTFVKLLQSTLT